MWEKQKALSCEEQLDKHCLCPKHSLIDFSGRVRFHWKWHENQYLFHSIYLPTIMRATPTMPMIIHTLNPRTSVSNKSTSGFVVATDGAFSCEPKTIKMKTQKKKKKKIHLQVHKSKFSCKGKEGENPHSEIWSVFSWSMKTSSKKEQCFFPPVIHFQSWFECDFSSLISYQAFGEDNYLTIEFNSR